MTFTRICSNALLTFPLFGVNVPAVSFSENRLLVAKSNGGIIVRMPKGFSPVARFRSAFEGSEELLRELLPNHYVGVLRTQRFLPRA